MRTVLDTSVLIGGTAKRVEGELAISAATLAELNFGVLITEDADERAKRLAHLNIIQGRSRAIPMDDAVAVSYAVLAAATVRAGRQPRRRQFDLVIAATAHAHRARLATADYDDVSHLSHLIDIIRA